MNVQAQQSQQQPRVVMTINSLGGMVPVPVPTGGLLAMNPLARSATQPHPHGHSLPSPPPPHHTMHAPNAQQIQAQAPAPAQQQFTNPQQTQGQAQFMANPQQVQQFMNQGFNQQQQRGGNVNGARPQNQQRGPGGFNPQQQQQHMNPMQQQMNFNSQQQQYFHMLQQQQAHGFPHPGNPQMPPTQQQAPPQQQAPQHQPQSFPTYAAPHSYAPSQREKRRSNEVCVFWRKGSCRYMQNPEQCAFVHALPSDDASMAGTTASTSSADDSPASSASTPSSVVSSSSSAPAAAAPINPLSSFGGWLVSERVHRFRGLTVLERANAQAMEVAAARAAVGPEGTLVPTEPQQAAHYRSTLHIYAPAHAGSSFQSLVQSGDHRAVRVVRDVVALMEQDHHIVDYHLNVVECRSAIPSRERKATPASAGESDNPEVNEARAFLADENNWHIKVHFGGVGTPLPVREHCMACEDKQESRLIEQLMYNNVSQHSHHRPQTRQS
jgi:hypothetical protein